jgi:hypothetical protein
MSVLETSYQPKTIASVSTPGTVYSCMPVNITANSSGNLDAGEYVYLRYTIDNWASSQLLSMSFTGTLGTATIPAQTAGTTIKYYVFSSNQSTLSADYDFFTLSINNNSTNNYQYTVSTSKVCLLSSTGTTSAGYSTLKAAFDAINAGTHTGNITITIAGDTTENATAVLNASGSGSASYSSIFISPSGARTISGNLATQLIDLNGADNVTIDGLNTGGNSLTIDNSSSTASNGTIRLVNDAQYNTITNCTIKGSSNTANSAVIFFSAADGTLQQGNDNNVISFNTITRSSGAYPIFGILSYMVNTSPATRYNQYNQVLNNSIVDCLTQSQANSTIAAGIQLSTGSSDWTIDGNSIYYSGAVSSSISMTNTFNYGIRVVFSNATNIQILNNYVGGTSPGCGGSALMWSNTSLGNKFCGISINTQNSGTASSIQGNTIANITLNTNSSQANAPCIFSGISIEGGLVNVGTMTGNTIGSSTSNSININVATNAAGVVTGIVSSGTSTSPTISNNTISGISLTNPSSGNVRVNFRGIYIIAQPATIVNNAIGSTSFSPSIQNATGNTATLSFETAGISVVSTSTVSASNNTIANLSYSAASSGSTVVGIASTAGTFSATSNTIRNLSSTAINTGTGTGSSVIGISCSGVTTLNTISQNTIYSLGNSATTAATVAVAGIVISSAGIGHSYSRNLIYSLTNNSSNSAALIEGVRVSQGTYTFSNNMIALGNSVSQNLFINGIRVEGGTGEYYFNTVAISGSTSGNAFSNAIRFNSTNSGTIVQNNIFYNTRTSSNASNDQALYFTLTTQRDNVTTCNYNNLYVGSSNTVLVTVTGGTGSPYANLSAWQTNSGGRDANSLSASVSFSNIAADLHITSTECGLIGAGTAVSVTVDYDGSTRPDPPAIGADEYSYTGTTWTWTGNISTDWHENDNWCPRIVPVDTSDVIIPAGPVNMPLISNADAECHTININLNASLSMSDDRLLTLYTNDANVTFTNSGTFNEGSGDEQVRIDDNSAGTLTGTISGTIEFNNFSTNTGVNFGSSSTINSTFRMDGGAYVFTNAPLYATGSLLHYSTNSTPYYRGLEWSAASGKGYPYNVQVGNNTTLDATGNGGYETQAFACANNLTIDNGSALYMDYGTNDMTVALTVGNDISISGSFSLSGDAGGDIRLGGDWTRAAAGNFYPNNRAIFFTGTADQLVTRTGGGTETFPYVIIDKANAGTYVKPDNAAGNLTDLTINGTAGDVLQLNNNGGLDVNGRTVTIDGAYSGATPTIYIYVNGTRTIINSQGLTAGKLAILGTNTVSNANNFTAGVRNNAGTGSLTFEDNLLVTIGDGHTDFGISGLTYITTVRGVLQVNYSGNVYPNPCYYAIGSTLRFANTIDYQVNATDITWATGDLFSGLPGIPYNVEVLNNGTDLTINDARSLRNDLTITDGRFTLNAGPFKIGGDWSRSGSTSAFTPNTYRVIFDGNVDQTITCTANSNTETYYQLEISNSEATPEVTLSGSTDAVITNELVLTTGKLTTGTNEVSVTNTAASAVSGHRTDVTLGATYTGSSYVNGNLRRSIAVTSVDYDFPVGTASNYQMARLNFANKGSISNILASFTAGAGGSFTNCAINGTPIMGMLNGGYWTMTPDVVVAPLSVSYDVTLHETGYTDVIVSSEYVGLIKRENSGFAWGGTFYGSDGGHANASQALYTSPNIAKSIRISVPTFSDFAIGFSNNFVLPITLTTFSVSPNGDDALLNWNTSAEYNSDHYVVERSVDGDNFEEIGQVDAAGWSLLPLDYSFLDYSVSELGVSKIYYRLKMVDADLSFDYSPVRWINITGEETELSVFPNPFTDQLSVQWFANDDGQAVIRLTDVSGKLLHEQSVSFSKGSNFFFVDNMKPLAAGMYLLQLNTGRFETTQKVVKQ